MVLIIGGHMRSGTTLLKILCNSHPDIALTQEFNYFSNLGKTYAQHSRELLKRLWKNTTKKRMKKINFKEHVRNHLFVARYLFYMRRYRKSFIDIAAIESTLRSVFPEARIYGDKTPTYVFLLDELVATSGLSCLIIYRDCRDVTSDFLERLRTRWLKSPNTQKYPKVDTAEKVARRWVYCIELMEHHKDKIHIIRYEDLVQEPRRELEALAKWLGVDSSGFSERIIRSIRNTDIGKYKTGLTDEELKTVMDIAGPTMKRIGYM